MKRERASPQKSYMRKEAESQNKKEDWEEKLRWSEERENKRNRKVWKS